MKGNMKRFLRAFDSHELSLMRIRMKRREKFLEIGTGTAFATGMAGYTIRTVLSYSESFNTGDMFAEGAFNAISGMFSVGGAIALPAFLYSGPTVFMLAVSSGVVNGVINEAERSIKYNTDFSIGGAAYDATIYSILNLIPFVKGPLGAVTETLLIDTAGFYFADKYKDDFFDGLNRFDNDFRSELRKTPLQIF
jgi:hypothetical protein